MDVLISGAGIAGPCLAWWLLQDGHRVTIVEKAPRFRAGGYVIDFWGKGYDLAERMGLMPRLDQVGYHVNEVRFVDAHGRRRGGFDVRVLDRITHRRRLLAEVDGYRRSWRQSKTAAKPSSATRSPRSSWTATVPASCSSTAAGASSISWSARRASIHAPASCCSARKSASSASA